MRDPYPEELAPLPDATPATGQDAGAPAGIEVTDPEEFARQLSRLSESLPARINLDSESVEHGLVKLVLTLIEFLRRLMEKQAVRRMEGGLPLEQVEELGLALMRLEGAMERLRSEFGLE